MKKFTEKELADMRDMAYKYYQSCKDEHEKFYNKLPEKLKEFANDVMNCTYNSKLYKSMNDAIISGKCKKPSDYIRKELGGLFAGWIAPVYKDYVYYAADNCQDWAFGQSGLFRRSFHSKSPEMLASQILGVLRNYSQDNLIPVKVMDFLTDNLSKEQIARKYCHSFRMDDDMGIAYEIDSDNKQCIELIEDILNYNSDMEPDYAIIRGVLKSHNLHLHELLGKLLLAARLQEGLRQAICESADCGTIEGFKTIIHVIDDNNLIRYSSVKRAVGTWMGMFPDPYMARASDLERVTEKTVRLAVDCIESEETREECLTTEDSMKIFTALWAYGVYDIEYAVERIEKLAYSGSRHQILTAGYMVANFCSRGFAHRVSAAMIKEHSDKQDILAVYLPEFMQNVYRVVSDLIYDGSYNRYDEKYEIKKKYCDFSVYFKTKEVTEKYYNYLKDIYLGIQGKEVKFSPCIFPWHSAALLKSDVLFRMAYIASALKDNDKIDEMVAHILEFDSQCGERELAVYLLLVNPETAIQKTTVVSCVADKESGTRNTAFKIVSDMQLEATHFRQLEDMLKYKNSDIRANVLKLIMKQDDTMLLETVNRLITDKKEEKRTAGYDIILQLSENVKRKKLFDRCQALVTINENTTTKEKILIEQILDMNKVEEDRTAAFYNDKTTYTPVIDKQFVTRSKEVFDKYFYHKNKDFEIALESLIELISQHKDDEYKNFSGEIELLGNNKRIRFYGNEPRIAFEELWEKFYTEQLNSDYKILYRTYFAYISEADFNEFAQKGSEIIRKLVGGEFTHGKLCRYFVTVGDVLEYLMEKYVPQTDKVYIAGYFASQLINYNKPLYVTQKRDWLGDIRVSNVSLANHYQISFLLSGFDWQGNLFEFDNIFPIWYMLQQKENFTNEVHVYDRIFHIYMAHFSPMNSSKYVIAGFRKIISEEFMYKVLFAEDEKLCKATDLTLSNNLSVLSDIVKKIRENDKHVATRQKWGTHVAVGVLKSFIGDKNLDKLNDDDKSLLKFTEKVYNNLIDTVLATELKRGDTETKYSRYISGIKRIYGIEKYIAILSALGRETLNRSTYYYSFDTSKRNVLSYLLSVCVPDEGDSADRLREFLKGTDISEERLVEAALFTPEWLDITEEYLGWEGFKSACYYFIAHMNESLNDTSMAVIAKYSPLSTDEFTGGAFDINWFKNAYDTLGKKRFDMVYKAAKYISDGAKHTRARKYADAATNVLDIADTKLQIEQKRNKDLLMAYALIPIKDDKDMLERYLYMEQFLKESKKFGSQRAASEANAVEMAKKNLSINAGMEDVTRLTLRMETSLLEANKALIEDKEIDEISVRLEIDSCGKTDIVCIKAGKQLKSIPSKYKKDEYIVLLNDMKKRFNEQCSRTMKMFEHAMEDETCYLANEIRALMSNPVIKPIVDKLVFALYDENYINGENNVTTGFIAADNGIALIDAEGNVSELKEDDRLVVVHPYILYKSGMWRAYQRNIFARQIKQPFKQIFRELYVKTEDEKGMEYSMRYSGYQLQPKKAAAALKSRRWIADIEDGLQKIYYKENIIARIYARADWFTPSDVEAPAIEWVEFYNRKNGKRINLDEISDIIFSEIMRDVDLAVSVAYVGGVDPETSHSTIEMRAALIELTMPLFKFTNVSVNGKHAQIVGQRADYTVHLGSGVVHQKGGAMISILPVHSGQRGKLFLPFVDDDPKTAEILTKIIILAEDEKIKDPNILCQLNR